MLVFTSCLMNYLPKARVLGTSLKKFHPDWKFVLLLGEPFPEGESRSDDPFDIILYYEDLRIPNLKQWMFKHSVIEICTAVKGAAVCYFFEVLKEKKVIYLDPDIQVFNYLHEINKMLDIYDILLVPHHLKPQPSYDMIIANELSQMRNGIYNLGFVAFSSRSEGLSCARWWRDRLYRFCRNDVAMGLFTDQRWCDFIPSYFTNYHIIRDPGYDVASWNLTDRYVWIDEEGFPRANDSLIRFYHFTGYDSGAGKSVISHFAQQMPDLLKLWKDYDELLLKNGHQRLLSKKWLYNFFNNGVNITDHMRIIYRERIDVQNNFPEPFNAKDEKSYLSWYNKHFSGNQINYNYEILNEIIKSYSWKFIGSKLFHVESFIKQKLLKNKYPYNLINDILSLLQDKYNIINSSFNHKIPGKNLISLVAACFLIAGKMTLLIFHKLKKTEKNNLKPNADILHNIKRGLLKDNIGGNRLNVLYDLFFCRGFHGGGEYGKSVFMSLCNAFDDKQIKIWVAVKIDDWIEDYIRDIIITKNINVIPVNSYDEIIDLVNTDLFNSFFAPALVVYTGYIYQKKIGGICKFTNKKTKVIGVIHDVRDIEFALDTKKHIAFRKDHELYPEIKMSNKQLDNKCKIEKENAKLLIQMYKNLFECSSIHTVITDSKFSYNSIIKYIGNYGNKIITLHAPIKARVSSIRFEIYGSDPVLFQYALMINASRWEKNAAGAIKAFDLFFSKNSHENFYVVILGVSGIKDLGIKKINNIDKFIFINEMINSANLEYLYEHALFLIYPSFSEGFGYPPVEVMSYGIPSLVAKKGSIPDLLGNAAIYCDPFNINSIQKAITTIIKNPPSRKKLEKQYNFIIDKQKKDLEELISCIIDS